MDTDQYIIEPREMTAVVHTIALLLSVFSNICAVVIIGRTPTLHTPTCILMVALALVDIMLSVVWNVTPLALLDNDLRKMLPNTWVCNAIGLYWQVMVTMSALLQGIIAFDRYFFIVHPLKYKVHVTNKRAVLCCIVVLVFASSLPTVILINGSSYTFNSPAMTCSGSTLWSIWFLVVLFTSVTIAAISYQRVWKLCCLALKQQRLGKANERLLLPSLELRTQKTNLESKVHGSSRSLKTEVLGMSRKDNITTTELVSTVIKKNTTMITTTVSETLPDGQNITKEVDSFTSHSTLVSPVSIMVVQKMEDSIENTCKKSTTRKKEITTICGPDNVFPGNVVETTLSSGAPFHTKPRKSLTRSTFTNNRSSVKMVRRKMSQKFLINALEEICLGAKAPVIAATMARENKNTGLTALQWTAISNPVISWMLSIEEQGGNISKQGSIANMARVNQNYRFLSSAKLRRVKVLLLVVLPVFCVAFSFLPLLIALIHWNHGSQTQSDFLGIRIVCHISYSVTPSATSLLLYLTNKPYRCVLRNQLCCGHKRLRADSSC